jgi:arsenite methyltransferase
LDGGFRPPHHLPAALDPIAVRSHSDDNVVTMERRSDYGFDAPYALVTFAALGAASAVAATGSLWGHQSGHLTAMMGFYSAFFLGNALSFLYTTRRGKFQVWDEVLDELHLRGDERVLDMGCGRGAVLTAVASRLRTGRATGIDLWSTHDQSGNSRDVTMRNASLEGVQDRIDIETGDMRALPFPDATFDVVVSSLAIHNIHSNAARAQAIGEAWRVLKPGGRLAIADIRVTARYVETLRRLGATAIARRGLGWRFWYGNPFAGTSLVTASKRQGT